MKKHYFLMSLVACLFVCSAKSQRISFNHPPQTDAAIEAIKSGGGGGGSQCVVPAPAKTSLVSSSSSALFWKVVAGAAGYEVQVENALGNIIPFAVDTTVTDTACVIIGLRLGASYKFKVRTVCGNGHSNWSPYFFFKQFGKGFPPCNSTVPTGLKVSDVTASAVNLSWTSAGAAAYVVEVEGGDSVFQAETEIARGAPAAFTWDTVVRDTTCAVRGLSAGARYKFKVRSICYDDTSHWSVAFNFTTAGGGAPVIFHARKPAKSIATEGAQLKLYPNPAHEAVSIMAGREMGERATMTIYDATGKAVLMKQLNSKVSMQQVSISHLTAGPYYVVITSEEATFTSKLNVVR